LSAAGVGETTIGRRLDLSNRRVLRGRRRGVRGHLRRYGGVRASVHARVVRSCDLDAFTTRLGRLV